MQVGEILGFDVLIPFAAKCLYQVLGNLHFNHSIWSDGFESLEIIEKHIPVFERLPDVQKFWWWYCFFVSAAHFRLVEVVGFGEASPEAQAAAALHNFFTYVAVKIVASQLEVCPFPGYSKGMLWRITQCLTLCTSNLENPEVLNDYNHLILLACYTGLQQGSICRPNGFFREGAAERWWQVHRRINARVFSS